MNENTAVISVAYTLYVSAFSYVCELACHDVFFIQPRVRAAPSARLKIHTSAHVYVLESNLVRASCVCVD